MKESYERTRAPQGKTKDQREKAANSSDSYSNFLSQGNLSPIIPSKIVKIVGSTTFLKGETSPFLDRN